MGRAGRLYLGQGLGGRQGSRIDLRGVGMPPSLRPGGWASREWAGAGPGWHELARLARWAAHPLRHRCAAHVGVQGGDPASRATWRHPKSRANYCLKSFGC